MPPPPDPALTIDDRLESINAKIDAVGRVVSFMLAGHLSGQTRREMEQVLEVLQDFTEIPDEALPEERRPYRRAFRVALETIGDQALRFLPPT